MGIIIEHPPVTLQLIACLIGSKPTERLAELLSAFEQEIQEAPSDLATEFAPYIYHLLKEEQLLDIADSALAEQLRMHALNKASVAIGRHHVLDSLGDKLEQAGIQCILLKGAAMAGMAYPDQAFRLGCDVDLLVRSDDYYRIEAALEGFAEPYDLYPDRPQFTDFVTERSFIVSKPAPVSFDVHRELTIPYIYRYKLESFFTNAIEHPKTKNLFTLSPEDNLLQFAMHAFYNLQTFNKHTVDAFHLIKTFSINWESLFESARSKKLTNPLLYLLDGVEQTFGYQAPSPEFSKYKVSNIQKVLARRLMSPEYSSAPNFGWRYRTRQLLAQALISGNRLGHLRFNYFHLKAKLLDRIRS